MQVHDQLDNLLRSYLINRNNYISSDFARIFDQIVYHFKTLCYIFVKRFMHVNYFLRQSYGPGAIFAFCHFLLKNGKSDLYIFEIYISNLKIRSLNLKSIPVQKYQYH